MELNTQTADVVAMYVDARALQCPLPLLKAKQALAQVAEQALIQVQATDPGSVADFQEFTRLAGHTLLAFNEDAGLYTYTIRKGQAR